MGRKRTRSRQDVSARTVSCWVTGEAQQPQRVANRNSERV
jgi:hypothetical protein